jgi:hypothetical protein
MTIREEIRELGKRKELNLDELKNFEGLSDLTDEQAQDILRTLEQLAKMLYQIHTDSINNEPCKQAA